MIEQQSAPVAKSAGAVMSEKVLAPATWLLIGFLAGRFLGSPRSATRRIAQ